MRPTCTDCALKHIAQASILLSESYQGYPTHFFLALGHLAEAGDELVQLYPAQASLVRAERKSLETNPEYIPDFNRLLETISAECEVCSLVPGSNPIAWTKCELRHPSVQKRILSCVAQIEGDPRVRSPYAVCRSRISCPPG